MQIFFFSCLTMTNTEHITILEYHYHTRTQFHTVLIFFYISFKLQSLLWMKDLHWRLVLFPRGQHFCKTDQMVAAWPFARLRAKISSWDNFGTRIIWSWKLASGQFSTGTIWHQEILAPGNFGTGTIWHCSCIYPAEVGGWVGYIISITLLTKCLINFYERLFSTCCLTAFCLCQT